MSNEQRVAVLAAREAGMEPSAIASKLKLPAGSVRTFLSRVRHGSSVLRAPSSGHNRLSDEARAALVSAAQASPGQTRAQIAAQASEAVGRLVSTHTVSKVLRESGEKHGLKRAKAISQAKQQQQQDPTEAAPR
jgi:transposase